MLRLTGDTLVAGLFRCSHAVVVSGLLERATSRMDTCSINVVAREVLGVDRTARIPILYAMSRVMSSRNLYIQHCAAIVDLGLRAENSTLQSRLQHWL